MILMYETCNTSQKRTVADKPVSEDGIGDEAARLDALSVAFS